MNATKLLISLIAAATVSSASASGILASPKVVEASDAAYEGAIMVSWSAVPGADAYRIYRNDSDDWADAAEIGVTSDTAFIDPITSHKAGVSYHYWIAAESGLAVSPLSDPDIGRPKIRAGAPGQNARLRQNFRRLRGLLKQ